MKIDELPLLYILVVAGAQKFVANLRGETDTWVWDLELAEEFISAQEKPAARCHTSGTTFKTSLSRGQINIMLTFIREKKGLWRRGQIRGTIHFGTEGFNLWGEYVPGQGMKVEVIERHAGPKIGEFMI